MPTPLPHPASSPKPTSSKIPLAKVMSYREIEANNDMRVKRRERR